MPPDFLSFRITMPFFFTRESDRKARAAKLDEIVKRVNRGPYSAVDLDELRRYEEFNDFKTGLNRASSAIRGALAPDLGVSEYNRSDFSYSGADIKAVMLTDTTQHPVTFGSIATISISTHREKIPVRRLGSVNSSQYTRGTKTFAGSLIFLTFDQHVLFEMLNGQSMAAAEKFEGFNITPDQLPLFDIVLSMHNEADRVSNMAILGVDLVDEGQVFSVDDMVSEHTFSFTALDVEPLEQYQKRARGREPFSAVKSTTTSILNRLLTGNTDFMRGLIKLNENYARRNK
jgi:hypothetical protein